MPEPETSLSARQAWWIAIRPFSLPAAVVPVLVGTALAAPEAFRPGLFLLALTGSLLIQIATNLATDFFDFSDGVQPGASLGGVIRSGHVSASTMHRAAIATFAAGSLCGLAIVAFTGWPILVAGFVSVLAGYFYTASPIAYGRRGLGEVTVFVFMGLLMVCASYYVQTERLAWPAVYAALPVGLLVANILHANNLRDIENDRARGKVTIASLTGRPLADYMLVALTVSAYVCVALAVLLASQTAATLLVLLTLPAAWSLLRTLRLREARELNALVRGAALLHLRFGLLLSLGLLFDLL